MSEEVLAQVYNFIRDNEIDHLKELIDHHEINGIAHINFNFNEDEEVLNLYDGSQIKVSLLNPLLLAIKHKSLASLKYLA